MQRTILYFGYSDDSTTRWELLSEEDRPPSSYLLVSSNLDVIDIANTGRFVYNSDGYVIPSGAITWVQNLLAAREVEYSTRKWSAFNRLGPQEAPPPFTFPNEYAGWDEKFVSQMN